MTDIDENVINEKIDTEFRANVFGEAKELDVVEVSVVTSATRKADEYEKLKTMILQEGIGTMTARKIYLSGDIKLEQSEIHKYLTETIGKMAPEDAVITGIKGLALFDDLIDKAKDLLEYDCDGMNKVKDVNQTIVVIMAAMEKKLIWAEKFGFKPDVMNGLTDDNKLTLTRMTEIYNESKK